LVYEVAVGTKLHASLGRAYRAPSLLERYQPDVAFGNQVFQANPGLEPEYVLAADAGLEQRMGDACTLRLGGFYNDMDDLIATRQAGSVVSFENVDEARSAGIEAGIDCELTRGVRAFVNFTRQQTEDRATGRDLAYMPKDAAGIGLRVEQLVRGVGTAGSVTEQYVGRRGYVDEATGQWQSLDGYWRTDAAVKGSAGARGWAGVGVQNLTDERYQESSAVNPAPGRLWYVEAGVKL
jgi:outer membrane receptor protein involved in Fe transport